MEVTVEKLGQTVAKVSFTVPEEEFQKEFQSGLRSVGRNIRMKGFRPGKVPAHVVEKQHGAEVRREVREQFLRKAYQKAVEDEDLKPISHPRISLEDIGEEDDKGFTLEFEVSLRPEVHLAQYKGIEVDSELEPVMPETIQAALDDVRRQQSVPEPTGDDGIDESGMMVCDVAFLHEGEAVLEREGLRLSTETPPPGADPEAFKEAVLGSKEGDTLELDMVLPDGIEKEAARGQKGTCRIVLKEAFRLVPPSDEELLKTFEVENAEELNSKVREQLEQAHAQREESRVETLLLDRLIQSTEIELPEPLIADQTKGRLEQLHERMVEQGVPHEKIHEELKEQEATARDESERSLRALMIIETIGEKEELLVDKEDIDAELATIAERNQAEVEEVRKYYVENNLGQQMTIEILERKVRRFLRDQAVIKTPS